MIGACDTQGIRSFNHGVELASKLRGRHAAGVGAGEVHFQMVGREFLWPQIVNLARVEFSFTSQQHAATATASFYIGWWFLKPDDY